MRLPIFTLPILLLFCYNSYSQIVPKEDYITSQNSSGYSLSGSVNSSPLKGESSLFFTDSDVVLHFSGLGNKTIFFKIFNKRWDKLDKFAIIDCFDSAKNARHHNKEELKDSTPDLVIKISYTGKPGIDSNLSNSTKPIYINVNCFFYTKGFVVDFGFPVLFQTKKIPALRKKYSHLISG